MMAVAFWHAHLRHFVPAGGGEIGVRREAIRQAAQTATTAARLSGLAGLGPGWPSGFWGRVRDQPRPPAFRPAGRAPRLGSRPRVSEDNRSGYAARRADQRVEVFRSRWGRQSGKCFQVNNTTDQAIVIASRIGSVCSTIQWRSSARQRSTTIGSDASISDFRAWAASIDVPPMPKRHGNTGEADREPHRCDHDGDRA